MNILVLEPGQQTLRYSYFYDVDQEPLLKGTIKDYSNPERAESELTKVIERIREARGFLTPGDELNGIAVCIPYGGKAFRHPELVSATVIKKLEKLIPLAPLHLPAVLKLVQYCEEVFSGIPVIAVFETAFFADLPPREYLYALDAELVKNAELRRFGYHGLFHEGACSHVKRVRRKKGITSPAHILSVCLEPIPEIAAVVGRRPLMITSGATPLEGILGHTTCGELDPSIVIEFAEKMKWGPEQINSVLTKESGLLGLAGEPVTFKTLFGSDRENLVRAREIILYRMLLACGAGIAAMGGIDSIVFSGRFVEEGKFIAPYLQSRLACNKYKNPGFVTIEYFRESLDRLIAENAAAVLLSGKASVENAAY